VDWNNDGDYLDSDEATIQTGSVTHDFGSAGTYTIRIKGDFPRVYFNNSGDKEKIISLDQWGTTQWVSMDGAFYGAVNLQVPASDIPNLSAAESLNEMFRGAAQANPDTTHWNTSNITSMTAMFHDAVAAMPNTSNWNTTAVTSMQNMFRSATLATPNTYKWDTTNVTSMHGMFRDSANATPDTAKWNTAKVTDMYAMFLGAAKAQPITTHWNTANVTNMAFLFKEALLANPDVSNWNTANVTHMNNMFYGAVNATPETTNWNTSAVTTMAYMFKNAVLAQPNVSKWNTSNVEVMIQMFYGAAVANPDLSNWNIAQVTNMTQLLTNTSLSSANYDAALINFADQPLKNNVQFGAGNTTYCEGGNARNTLSSANNWLISDAGQNCTPTAILAPDLTPASDLGDFNFDNITANTTPEFLVECHFVANVITLYSDMPTINTAIGDHVCAGLGLENVTASPLSDGIHQISYTEQRSGDVSSHSPTLSVTINQQSPVVAIALSPLNKQSILTAQLTNSSVEVTGQASGGFTPGDLITVELNGQSYIGVADFDGRFSLFIPATELMASDSIAASISSSNVAGNSSSTKTETHYTTEHIDINATGLLTLIKEVPLTAVMTDKHGAELNEQSSVGNYFAPGKHFVRWLELDNNNQQQVILRQFNVFPQVTLAKDAKLLEGNKVNIKVYLNGDAPNYPLDVAYSVTGTSDESDHDAVDGTVTFSSGREAAIEVTSYADSLDDNNETLIITLVDTVNQGSNANHTTIISDILLPPKARLAPYQDQQLTHNAAQDNGLIVVKMQPKEGLAQDYDIEWRPSISGLENLSNVHDEFAFDPTLTKLGNVSFVAVITDVNSLQATIATNVSIFAQPTLLTDQPCYIAQGANEASKANLVEAEFEVCISSGDVALATESVGLQVPAQNTVLPPDDGFENIGGVFDYVAFGLAPGSSYHIVFPQSKPIPEQPVFRKYVETEQGGLWRDFITSDTDFLSSSQANEGVCPPPNDSSWIKGLAVGNWCVQLTITDGGPNDDGLANGIVVDPGGVSTLAQNAPEPVPVPEHKENQTSGGSLSLMWLMLLILIGLYQQHYRMRSIQKQIQKHSH